MARIRADYVFGTTTAALSAADTTLSSAELARLPAVTAPDVAAVTLHDAATGTYEIVHVTAHTAAATTATILRAREGSVAAAWASGSSWLHAPTAEDFADAGAVGNGFVGAVLTKSATQTLVAGVETAVTFDGEVRDTNAFHDNVTNTTRLTAPVAGTYLVGGTVEVAALPSGAGVIVRIRKNGANVTGDGRSRTVLANGVSFPSPPLSRPIEMAAGDYVEITVEASAVTGGTTLIRPSADGTSFWIMATNTDHTHDDRYYTETEADGRFRLNSTPVVLPAGVLGATTGTPTLTAAPANRRTAWLLDATTVERVAADTAIPADWANVRVTALWANAGAGAGNVKFRAALHSPVAGEDVNTFIVDDLSPAVVAAGAQWILQSTVLGTTTGFTAGSKTLFIYVDREANHVGDTLANDIALYALILEEV